MQPETTTSRPALTRLMAGTFWNLWANAVYRGVSLALSIYLAHLLTNSEYADFNTLQNALTTLFTVASFGLGLAATRFTAELAATDKQRCSKVMSGILLGSVTCSAMLALLLCVSSEPIAGLLLKDETKYGQIVALSGLLITTVLISVQGGIFAGLQAFRTSALVQTLSGAASLALQFAIARTGSFSAFLLAWVAGNMLVAFLNHLMLGRLLKSHGMYLQWTGAWRALGDIAGFFIPASAAPLVVFPAHTVALLILDSVGRNAIEVSWFQTGLLWVQLIAFVPTALAGTLLPMLTSVMHQQGSRAMMAWAHRGVFPVLTGIMLLCIAFVMIAPSIALLYGPKFQDAADIFRIAAVTGFFFSINGLLGNFLVTHNAMRAAAVCNATWTLAYLGLAATAGRFHGAHGMLASCLGAYLVHFLALVIVVRKLSSDPQA